MDEVDKIVKRTNAKPARDEMEVLQKVEALFKENKYVKDGEWSAREIDFLNTYSFLTAKPGVYLVNISQDDYFKKKNKYLPKISAWIQEHGGGPMIPFSAEYEAKVVA